MLTVEEKAYPYRYKRLKTSVNYELTIKDYTRESANDSIENKFTQNIEVDFHGENKGFQFRIKVSNEKYDVDKKITYQKNFIEQLATLTRNTDVLVNSFGDIVDVSNYREILEKWDILKTRIKQNNKGAIVDAYLKQIESNLKDKAFFIKNLKQYRLFGLLFNNLLDIPFDDKRGKVRQRTFDQAIRSIPISINEKIKLIKEGKETNLLDYKVTGNLNPLDKIEEERIKAYLKHFNMKGSSVYLEEYSGVYKVNKYTAWTESADISLKLTNGRGYQRNVEYRLKKLN
ncbi:hypothetical protein A8C32_03760 [Flavivirga aquatica]|uniref:Uncharacterized protein n=1 Tax=Flavivirga aquatica TaxID=1849968 RepID=A0A1E5TB75_9FLAO|nr:hypothetical protein [Flavivirga aquatica]OEK08577.1 hypothetical protein A8C32_03760 [Flavivirga aquatica]